MKATVKVSFHPGKKCTREHIKNVIDFVYQNKNISVEFSDEITILTGEYEEIMKTLSNAVVTNYKTAGMSEFTIKTHIIFE